MSFTEGFLQKPRLHILLLVFLGLLAYSNTFDAPFLFDDYVFINYLEVELHVARAGPDIISLDTTRGPWASRPLLYYTFVLNLLLDGFNSWGYHIMNIALHLGNGILLYFLLIMKGRHLGHKEKDTVPVALLSSLIFVLHPVQTEAVTYVINRSMLMATAFYLLGLIFFLKAVTSSGRWKYLFVLGLLVSAVMGAASRENFATFFLMVFIYDLFFVSRFRLRAMAGHFREYAAVLPGIACLGYLVLTNTYDTYEELSGLKLPPEIAIPPLQYALTQFKVHWTYIRLLIFPVNQNLDYSYPVAKSLFELPAMLSFLGYLGLWAGGGLLARKRPVAAFGLLWFLVALMPVSFAVALLDLRLGDVIFEHRFYLPSVGLIVLAAVALVRLARGRRALVPAIVALCLVLGGAAYARNSVWADEETLWRDTLRKSPNNPRAHNNFGVFLRDNKRNTEAIEHFEAAIKLWPNTGEFYSNMGDASIIKREVDKAIEYLNTAVELSPSLWRAHARLGTAYTAKEQYEEALEHYLAASDLAPWNTAPLNNVARTYYALGQKDEAIKYYISSLWLNKKQTIVLNNLGVLFMETGQEERAIKHLEPLVALEPDYPFPRLALGRLYIDLGFPLNAIEHLEVAKELLPDEPEIQQALTDAYRAAKDKQRAAEQPWSYEDTEYR